MELLLKLRRAGFTIVELLIVIAIIGILAAITLVAYNGIIQRADNAKTKALVNHWEKSIRLYQVFNKKLPNDWTCLGQSASEFAAISAESIGTGQCERNVIVVNASPDWTSELKTVPTAGQTLPTPTLLSQNASLSAGLLKMYRVKNSNAYIRGIVYSVIFDPAQAPNAKPGAYIFYVLKGENCPSDRVYRQLDDLRVCAARLTSDNYANEVYSP